jgi:hypothetical protein
MPDLRTSADTNIFIDAGTHSPEKVLDDDNPPEVKLEIEELLDCEKPTGKASVLSWPPGHLSFFAGGNAWQPPRSVAAIESR